MRPVFVLVIFSLLFLPVRGLSAANPYVTIIGENTAALNAIEPARAEQELHDKIALAQRFYLMKQKKILERVNQEFQIDFEAIDQQFRDLRKSLAHKESLIRDLRDAQLKKIATEKLNQEYGDTAFRKYMDAFYYFENELAKDPGFAGEVLPMFEDVLELLVGQEVLFRYIFQSQEFRMRHGLVLKKVRGPSSAGGGAEIQPLDVRTLFADETNAPVVIQVDLDAFETADHLRSVLIHKISDLFFIKPSLLEDGLVVRDLGDLEKRAFQNLYQNMNPLRPSYEDELIRAYYGYKCQLLYEDRLNRRLPFAAAHAAAHREYLINIMNWAYEQLSPATKLFILSHPDPPVFQTIERYF